MHHLGLLVLFALAAWPLDFATTTLAPNWNSMRTKHRWNAVPEKWECIGNPPVGTTIDLRIALRPQREGALIDALYKVSNPKHPKYGAYLSKEQVAELVAPHPDSLKLIESWLKHHDMSTSKVSRSHGGGWLTVTGVPVSKANDLLGASYQLYQYAGTNDTILRTMGYALPSVLHGHVRTVAPTTYFGTPGTLWQTPRVHRRGGVLSYLFHHDVTPPLLRSLYNSDTYVPVKMDQNVLGITGFHGEYAKYEDLTEFMREYRADGIDATFTVVDINDSEYNPNNPGREASLNIQYAQAIAYPTRQVFYSTGGLPAEFIPDSLTRENDNEPYLEWVEYMIGLQSLPQTISTSYSVNEQTFPPDYAVSVCDLFAQLGLRGVSLLFSSGNHGVGASDCKKNDGSDTVEFQPQFPSSCEFDLPFLVRPFVTSVGGTRSRNPEIAARFSSGGFSNVFKREPYQDDAVTDFFQTLGGTYAGLYNASSRGFPDVSAQAFKYLLTIEDGVQVVSGTSCSTPVVAGLISLLNDFRLSKDKPPLGFLNPLLYGEARPGFTDITSGSNPGCGTKGFSAVPGWDPVTGLGTPNFKKLLEIQSVLITSTPPNPL
ncbi:peptidase S8/S53 domain-containing protein [Lactarius quietus]|nr:peptidase S8/S53 domain-containing protein [Lactarius quietus]